MDKIAKYGLTALVVGGAAALAAKADDANDDEATKAGPPKEIVEALKLEHLKRNDEQHKKLSAYYSELDPKLADAYAQLTTATNARGGRPSARRGW